MNKRDELAKEYLKELMKNNPDGFSVSHLVNTDAITITFCDGYDAALSEADERVKGFNELALEAAKRCYNNCYYEGHDPQCEDKLCELARAAGIVYQGHAAKFTGKGEVK